MDENSHVQQELQLGKCTDSSDTSAPRVLLEILRASGAKPEFLRAAKFLRCEGCDAHRPKAQTSKVTLPRTYEFNRTVGG